MDSLASTEGKGGALSANRISQTLPIKKEKGKIIMKKIISLIIAIVMIASLSTAVFAAETGTITINGATANNVYEIYKLLGLESYDTTTGAYSYKVNSVWTGFFATAAAKEYMTVDTNGYALWKGAESDERVAAFAKLALAYAEENSIAPVKSSSVTGDCTVIPDALTGKQTLKFAGLDLGYYLVDSTMGALCGLTTTNPNASINAKNGAPTVDKQVQEDSTSQWGNENTADIGQLVHFRVTINVHSGAQNYVLHDKMTAGLTFVEVEKVVHIIPTSSGHTETIAPAAYYSVVQTGRSDDCTFEVRFTQAFCDHLETNDKIVVYYTAKLNESAAVGASGNTNEAWLEFGDNHYTTHDSTVTKTFGFYLVKTDSQNILLDGAEFRIYDASTAGNEVKVVKMADGSYRRAEAGETGESIVVKDGKVRVVGFDNGTYYLEETVNPTGYNKLTARQRFIISDANLDAIFNSGNYSTGSGVQVINKSGTMLPETGGIGTVLFVTFGTMTALGAGVLLVTKKRMGMIEE